MPTKARFAIRTWSIRARSSAYPRSTEPMLANFFVPILQDGWRFIAIFAGVTFLAALTGVAWLFWPMFVLTLWSIYFFRDPPRGVPQEDRLLVAPADGLVQMVV